MNSSAESLERRLVVQSSWLAMVFSAAGVVTNTWLGGTGVLIWGCALSALGFAAVPWLARRGVSTRGLASGFLVVAAFLLASTWEANGGVRSSTTSAFSAAIVFSVLTLPSRAAVWAIIGVLAFFLLLCVIELADGVPAPLPFVGMDEAIDVIITTLFTATLCGIGVTLMRRGYEANLRELQQAKARIEDMAEVAIAADREKTRFLARMSHDLRTPLTAVLGSLDVAGRDQSLSPALAKLLACARERCVDLERMTADLLDVGLLETGSLARQDAVVELPHLLQSIVDIARPRAGVRLRASLEPKVPAWVLLDGTRVTQALSNLLNNACKHTDHGEISLSAAVVDGRLRFTVTDTGPGIAPEDLARLGQAFVQLERGRQRGGVGLGLFNAERIAGLLEGQLRLSSTPGVGTTAVLDLPLMIAQTPPVVVAPALPRRMQVLVADDDPALREILSAMLEALDCVVEVVENGALALACVQARAYDVVFLDMNMPVMDGLSAAREIRAQRPTQRLIALTANAYPADMQRFFDAGVHDFLAKPVTLSRLSAALAGSRPESG
ncbi:MAG: response regulator [Xanthomonadales bacterium]|jgi:signal transduction histidine kinase|nr:response regulator [Xanthomonadales bacterium]